MAPGGVRQAMGRAAWVLARVRFLIASGGVPRVTTQLAGRVATLLVPTGTRRDELLSRAVRHRPTPVSIDAEALPPDLVLVRAEGVLGTVGWLAPVLRLLDDEQVGAVAPMVVDPSGRLLEAGLGRGAGGRADDSRFRFVRPVEGSAACLVVRRSVIAGGADVAAADASALLLRSGVTVLYQPASVVVAPSVAPAPDERRQVDGRPAPRILVVDKFVPTPDRDTGSLRLLFMMRLLAERGASMTFAPLAAGGETRHRVALEQAGIEVLSPRGGLDRHLAGSGTGLQVVMLVRRPIARSLLARVRTLAPGAKVVYETVDLESVREQRRAAAAGGAAAAAFAAHLQAEEVGLVRDCDATVVTTPEEEGLLRAQVPDAAIVVIPTIHAVPDADGPAFASRHGLVFVGNFRHGPNVDAVRHLVDDLMPRLRAVLPGITLTVVGGDAPRWMRQLQAPGVIIAGWVADLTAVYDAARVAVIPLRFGAGMKGKVTEAMGRGVPVVTTTVGAEGIGGTNGEDLMVADDDDAFVAAVVRTHEDSEVWRSMSDRGRLLVHDRYSPSAVAPRLAALMDALDIPL